MTADLHPVSDSVDRDQVANRVSAQLYDQKATRVRLGGIGLTKLYELWGTAEKPGPLGSVYIGKRRYSSEAQIEDFIQRLESKQESAS